MPRQQVSLWFILSAEHGLVRPDTICALYELYSAGARRRSRDLGVTGHHSVDDRAQRPRGSRPGGMRDAHTSTRSAFPSTGQVPNSETRCTG